MICYIKTGTNELYGFSSIPTTQCLGTTKLGNADFVAPDKLRKYDTSNGYYELISISDIPTTFISEHSDYILHSADESRYIINANLYYGVAFLSVLLFFFVIYKWFIRFRG